VGEGWAYYIYVSHMKKFASGKKNMMVLRSLVFLLKFFVIKYLRSKKKQMSSTIYYVPPCSIPHLQGSCSDINRVTGGENPVTLSPAQSRPVPADALLYQETHYIRKHTTPKT
jgi:hypothetical protein